MGFWESYSRRYQVGHLLIEESPDRDLFCSVVIPCHDEPELGECLRSLENCQTSPGKVEVIVVVNHSVEDSPEIKFRNHACYSMGKEWAKAHSRPGFRVFIIPAFDLPAKHAGVGWARKIGMDEAARRFGALERPLGLITGYDADCRCRPDYFLSLWDFYGLTGYKACSIHFEHPIEDPELTAFEQEAIVSYELYLRYLIHAQRAAGYPLAFQTVGSSFGVRAAAYTATGGMNRHKAGEDFYFLQKLIPLGGFRDWSRTVIFPSGRRSNRVPFGTGAAMEKMVKAGRPIHPCYKLESFELIKDFYSRLDSWFSYPETDPGSIYPPDHPLRPILQDLGFSDILGEIRKNSSNPDSFRKRFMMQFGAFWILRTLNSLHPQVFEWSNPADEARKLLERMGIKNPGAGDRELLEVFREIDRNSDYSV